MLDPEEFLDRLRELLGGGSTPSSDNPEEYETRAEIRDDDCLMLLAEMKHFRQRADRTASELDEVMHELGARKSRLYRKLEEYYPGVKSDQVMSRGGTGVRLWQGKYFFVGWTTERKPS